MALIKCPECGKEISDKASNCPNCGNPIAEKQNEATVQTPKVEVKAKEGCFLQTLNAGCMVIAGIIFIIFLIILLGGIAG